MLEEEWGPPSATCTAIEKTLYLVFSALTRSANAQQCRPPHPDLGSSPSLSDPRGLPRLGRIARTG